MVGSSQLTQRTYSMVQIATARDFYQEAKSSTGFEPCLQANK
jgi:hypothetical protein